VYTIALVADEVKDTDATSVVAETLGVFNVRLALPPSVIYEPFDYTPVQSNIDTKNGGFGFDGPWVSTISHGRIYWIVSPGLSFSTLPVAGNALSRYGSAGRAEAHRTISAASQAVLTGDNTTIWFSQLFSGTAANRNAMFIFGTESIKHTDNPYELSAAGDGFGFTTADIVGGVGGNGDGSINAIAFDNSIGATFVKGTYTPSPTTATCLIVGKINWKPDGTPDELFLFNITDMSREPAESEAFASITNLDLDQSAFDTVAMYDGTNSITDEIRFGNTFAEVMSNTPVDPTLPTIETGDNWVTWSGQEVTLDTTVTNNDDEPQGTLTYAWSADAVSLGDGNLDITITGADQEDVTVEVSKTSDTDDATVVTMTLAVTLAGKDPVKASITIDVYDDACKAANADGALEYDSSDFNRDCITNFDDFAELALAWLDDYTLTAPEPK